MKLDPSDLDDLRPLFAEIVRQTIALVEAERAKLNGRLGYTEPEAAALLGVAPHVLRDCRLRGEIKARLVGKKVIYSHDELVRFLREMTP